jgi:hypothetical protein
MAMAQRISVPALALLATGLVSGCGDDAGSEPLVCVRPASGESRMLVDHDKWRLATLEEDPWSDFRPTEDIACPEGARKTEDFAGTYAYSVITTSCGYTTVVQETVANACKGEDLYVWLWNYALTAPENATAQLGVQLGDTLIWSDTRPIPGPSALEATRVALPEDVPAGTPIYFHVRNHGSNSYELLELSIVGDSLPSP